MSRLKLSLRQAIGQKKHVLWDWNGTLLDDVDHAVRVVNTLLDEHSLPRIDREQYRQVFCFPVYDYYSKIGFDYQREPFESLCEKFVARFMAGFRDLPLVPDGFSVTSTESTTSLRVQKFNVAANVRQGFARITILLSRSSSMLDKFEAITVGIF